MPVDGGSCDPGEAIRRAFLPPGSGEAAAGGPRHGAVGPCQAVGVRRVWAPAQEPRLQPATHPPTAARRAATGGRGADAVLECVGSPGALALALVLARPGAVLASVGCHTGVRASAAAGWLPCPPALPTYSPPCASTPPADPSFPFTPAQAYDKNLTLRTGRCPARLGSHLPLPAAPPGAHARVAPARWQGARASGSPLTAAGTSAEPPAQGDGTCANAARPPAQPQALHEPAAAAAAIGAPGGGGACHQPPPAA